MADKADRLSISCIKKWVTIYITEEESQELARCFKEMFGVDNVTKATIEPSGILFEVIETLND